MVATNNIGVIGEKAKGVFGNLVYTMDEYGRLIPLEKGKNNLILNK